uniref:Uncharacterized protein n=1 Tax=Anopheles coluzzii TaxID=1518534 RepID=A0A8W7PU97_ANOCL
MVRSPRWCASDKLPDKRHQHRADRNTRRFVIPALRTVGRDDGTRFGHGLLLPSRRSVSSTWNDPQESCGSTEPNQRGGAFRDHDRINWERQSASVKFTRATFVKSAFSPYCRYSSSVDGTQCGSISTVSQWLKTSCGIARPDVCLRISVAKLNDSITGMTATGLAPTKYHYYPHNQHIYFLPECAIQQYLSSVVATQPNTSERNKHSMALRPEATDLLLRCTGTAAAAPFGRGWICIGGPFGL